MGDRFGRIVWHLERTFSRSQVIFSSSLKEYTQTYRCLRTKTKQAEQNSKTKTVTEIDIERRFKIMYERVSGQIQDPSLMRGTYVPLRKAPLFMVKLIMM